MTRIAFLTAFLLLAGFAPAAPVPKALVKPAANLEGDWRLESEERNGQPAAQRGSNHNLYRLTKDTLTLINENSNAADREYPGAFVTEPPSGGKPGVFEYTLNVNNYRRCGVYELDGDTLRVSFSKDPTARPEKLTSDGNGFLYTFKRVK